ncbi:MAG: polysaccharide biosynthesis/export family protein [Mariniphaga sp.]
MIIQQNIVRLVTLLLFLLLFYSCKTRKDLLYLQDIKDLEEQTVPGKSPEYLIKPDDNLYVNIITIDANVSRLFNPFSSSGSGGTYQAYGTPASQYINGYLVDLEGNIYLPIIGPVNVGGKSSIEAQSLIQEKASAYLKDASVQVKVLSFKITILGELRNPGVFFNYNSNMTVLEAIGMAGGVTDNAQLSQLLVVRHTPNGSKSYRIDLSKKSILSSDVYYLQPNDVIYVNSDKLKNIRLTTPTYSFILSAITSFLVILQYIRLQ